MRGIQALTVAGLLMGSACARADYFPPDAGLTSYDKSWFPPYLSRADEPSLWKLSQERPGAEIYRISAFPAFGWVVIMQLEIRSDGTGLLTLKEVAQCQIGPGRIRRRARFVLSHSGVEHFQGLMKGFWNWPGESSVPKVGDPTKLVVEGACKGRYHVSVNVAVDGNPAVPTALYLLKLTHTAMKDF